MSVSVLTEGSDGGTSGAAATPAARRMIFGRCDAKHHEKRAGDGNTNLITVASRRVGSHANQTRRESVRWKTSRYWMSGRSSTRNFFLIDRIRSRNESRN